MKIQEQYAAIATRNKNLLEKVIKYACATLKMSHEEFLNDIKCNLKMLLNDLKTSNQRAVKLRLERDKVRKDLEDIERAFCSSLNGDMIATGKNTGGKPNKVADRQVDKFKLKELLGQLVIESLLLEKSLENNNKLIIDFMNIIPRRNYIVVLEMTYVECMSNTRIAGELGFTTDHVDQARKRGIIDLVQILKNV